MYKQLKEMQLDRLDLDELVALHHYGSSLSNHFGALQLQTPEWLVDNVRALESDVKQRSRDALQKRLAQAKQRRASLATPEEKRLQAEQEIAALERALA